MLTAYRKFEPINISHKLLTASIQFKQGNISHKLLTAYIQFEQVNILYKLLTHVKIRQVNKWLIRYTKFIYVYILLKFLIKNYLIIKLYKKTLKIVICHCLRQGKKYIIFWL